MDTIAKAIEQLTEAFDEIDTLRQTNRLLLEELDEKDARIKRLELALSTGLMVSKSEKARERARRVKELAEQGLTSKDIELKLFGYKGGYAWRFVSRVLNH